MIPELWAHQARDVETYLQNDAVFNLSDPGTGKTRVCIEVIRRLKIPTLILAPKSILQCAWGDDIEKYAPEIRYSVATAENRAYAFMKPTLVKITNIDAAKWLGENPQYLKQFEGGFLIIDESTSLKNYKSLRTRAVTKFAPMFKKKTLMSGTPNPQGVIDLWSQVFILDGGQRLGKSHYKFQMLTYDQKRIGQFTKWVEKPGIADAVAGIIADLTVRNKREDCMDLPENLQTMRYVDLAPKQQKQYVKLKKEAALALEDGDVTAINAAALLTKLLQLTSGAVYTETGEYLPVHTDRYELVMDLVEERQACVVAFNWRHQREALMREAENRGLPAAFIDGSVSQDKRTKAVHDFQDGKLRVIFLHPASAAHGITLTRGEATIWASPTYNAEHFAQLNARIYRGGQTKRTETILICARHTVEEDAYAALFNKTTNLENLLEILS